MFSGDGKDETSVLQTHIKLYVFADRFNIPSLQDLCFNNLSNFLESKQHRRLYPHSTMLTAVIRAINYAIENLPSLRDRAAGCLISCLSWLLPRVNDLTQVKELFQTHKELEQELLHVSTPDGGSSDEPAWKPEDAFRLVMECSECQSMSLLVQVECLKCGIITSQARDDGWFTRGNRGMMQCGHCGSNLYLRCRRCVEVGLLHFTPVYNNVTAWEKVKYLDIGRFGLKEG